MKHATAVVYMSLMLTISMWHDRMQNKCETSCERVHYWDTLYQYSFVIYVYLYKILNILFVTKYVYWHNLDFDLNTAPVFVLEFNLVGKIYFELKSIYSTRSCREEDRS